MVVYVIITLSNVPSNSSYVLWPQPPRMKATASRPFSSSSSSSSLCRCCRNDSLVMVVVVCLLKELFRLFSGLQIPSCCLRLLNQLRVILKGNSNEYATAAKCHQHSPNNNSMKSLPQPFRILAGTYIISVVLCGPANYS